MQDNVQPPVENEFYYDQQSKRWIRRGQELVHLFYIAKIATDYKTADLTFSFSNNFLVKSYTADDIALLTKRTGSSAGI